MVGRGADYLLSSTSTPRTHPRISKLFGLVVAATPHDEHADENAEHDATYPHQNASQYELRVVAGPAMLAYFVRSDELGSCRARSIGVHCEYNFNKSHVVFRYVVCKLQVQAQSEFNLNFKFN